MLASGIYTNAAVAETFTLKVTPQTLAWGNYVAAAKPVLRIHSGDTVIFETLLTNSPTGLERNGVPPEQVERSLRDVFEHVPLSDRDPGGHILTGPVFIDGAEPGMLVSVAGDVDVTELVDRNKGMHVMMPKAIFH